MIIPVVWNVKPQTKQTKLHWSDCMNTRLLHAKKLVLFHYEVCDNFIKLKLSWSCSLGLAYEDEVLKDEFLWLVLVIYYGNCSKISNTLLLDKNA